ncbi:MAG: HBL/NHE enterotoxin family protein [Pseudonocardiaceae bacterium]
MAQPPTGTVKQALVDTHAPAIAAQSLTAYLGLIPPMNFHLLKDKTREEMKKIDPCVAQNAVHALEGIDLHTEKARRHADHWNKTLLPKLFETAADVHGYATEFLKPSRDLRQQIAGLGKTPTPEQQQQVLKSVQSHLTALRKPVDKRANVAEWLANALADFAGDVKSDTVDFEKDWNAVEKAITGQGGVIGMINQRVAELNDQLAKDAKRIAKGEIGIVPGIGLIVIGSIFVIGGVPQVGVGLLTGGLGLLTAQKITVGGVNLEREKGELAGLQIELSLLQASITCFHNTQGAVIQFSTNASDSSAGGSDLHQVWLSHDQALATIVKTIQDALSDPAADLSQLITEVDQFLVAAMDDWADGQKTADTVKNGLIGIRDNVDTTDVDDPQSTRA